MMDQIHFEKRRIDPLPSLYKFHTRVDVMRLDLLHPVISGNKWYKLKEYLKEAKQQSKTTILTFGGAFSNHIVATAAAARLEGLKSIGIIRGERPSVLSPTLVEALHYGMELHFVSRADYRNKLIPQQMVNQHGGTLYRINEGGYGVKGMEGASAILEKVKAQVYSHILVAVGTGTTLAGLTLACGLGQKVIGVSVLKNNFSLQQEIETLLPPGKERLFTLLHEYHFGGYAKYNQSLLRFMNDWYRENGIPSDFVYTGKLFFALDDLIRKSYFPPEARILVLHSGGLQGNRSLPKGSLIF
ncbi:MAG: 1-aminocyclopropane-1-carboxylate deaminase/D-cysteine desulfhydrase [Flavisolibacter sp.]